MMKFPRVGLTAGMGSFLLVFAVQTVQAQITTGELAGQQNVTTTSVPFLLITPDARSGGMGDAGVALDPDANSIHWNPSKLAFIEKSGGLSLSYNPWLRRLVPDISLNYLSGYKRIDDKSTFGGSLRYFSLGNINFTDVTGMSLGSFNPNEFAVDGVYARKLSKYFSIGVALRFIYSNLAGNIFSPSVGQIKPGVAGAGDISAYYRKNIKISGKPAVMAFGGNISNIGSKITYTTSVNRDFIPINLRLGSCVNTEIDKYNSIAFLVDFNKLLVPSNPVYARNPDGTLKTGPDGPIIEHGMDPDVGVPQGMIQSFYDAPGKGKEEFKEINYSVGMEYWYDKQFAFRTGYFHEPKTKGNRQFVSFGVGIRYNVFGLDAAYLVAFSTNHPLSNTLRFTLHFDFDAFKSLNKTSGKKKKA
jgi:hypothetical protein